MTEEFLDGPDVVPVLKEMCSERMAERVASGRLSDPSFAGGFLDGLLNDGFMQMMPVLLASRRIGVIL
jgi:hypothetical protein